MKVVILVGGKGTRIGEESQFRPKPMVEIGGRPILWHIMKWYSSFGFHEFILCCGYKGHMIKQYFVDYYSRYSDVSINLQNGGKEFLKSRIEPWKDSGCRGRRRGNYSRFPCLTFAPNT